MIAPTIRANDVNRLVAALKPVLYKRKHHAVLLIGVVEKSTDVTGFAELGACKANG
jgi:hypothetical protein